MLEKYYGGNNNERETTIIKFLSSLKEDNITKFEIFSEEYFLKLGMISDLSGWRAGEDIAHDIKNFFDFLIPALRKSNG